MPSGSDHRRGRRSRQIWRAAAALLWAGCLITRASGAVADDSVAGTKLPAVYLPPLQRPAVQLNPRVLEKQAMGFLPTHDGEPFQVNFRDARPVKDAAEAKARLGEFLNSAGMRANVDEIEPARPASDKSGLRDDELLERFKRPYEAQFQERLKRKLGKLGKRTIDEQKRVADRMKSESARRTVVYPFRQVHEGTRIENSQLLYVVRQGGFASITGNIFTRIVATNQRRVPPEDAVRAAHRFVGEHVRITSAPEATKAESVLVPFAEGFKYAWAFDVDTEEGKYRAWVDADEPRILQLLPLFSRDDGRGLRFNPSPATGTLLEDFRVDGPSGGKYSLTLSGTLKVVSQGADGCTGNVTVNSGSGSANFDVAPINSTNVQTASAMGYNCRFQEVNAFATVDFLRETYDWMGSQTFPMINVSVDEAGNSNSFDGTNTVDLSIGNATMGNTSSACPSVDKFSGAIDSTCIAHEFSHFLNMIQFAVSGGTLPSSLNEGLADWWADTIFDTDTFGAWYGQRCPATQSGFLPRQSEADDVFPRHRTTNGGQREAHSDGQMISWALWNLRRELFEVGALGVLIADVDVMKALTTSGTGVVSGISDKAVHDSFVDLERQLVTNRGVDWWTTKIVSAFAHAGLFLSDREAIIDIDDDYLNRTSATPPTFTVWTGRDYTFDGAGNAVTTGAVPFNTRFVIDVANDAGFTTNMFSSGSLGGVSSGQGGSAKWQLPSASWDVVKPGDHLYFRVRTSDDAGGNVRTSASTGDNTVQGIEVPFAVINDTGECECDCSTSSSDASDGISGGRRGVTGATLFLFAVPFAYGMLRRRRAGRARR
jgi:hypothetical protein